MSIIQTVKRELDNWVQPIEAGSHVVVPMLSLYPSNAPVQVMIEGGVSNFIVSDGGGALTELHAVGGHSVRAIRYMREACAHAGLKVSPSGWIYSSINSEKMLATTIALVADASRTAAINMIRHFKPEADYNFKLEFERFIENSFARQIERKGKLLGASNKSHSFDYIIDIKEVGKVAIDAVTPDANSINSAIVAHLDLSNAHRKDVRQFIVYDDRAKWRASDLALLSVGAPTIVFKEAQASLIKIAA